MNSKTLSLISKDLLVSSSWSVSRSKRNTKLPWVTVPRSANPERVVALSC